MDMPQAVKCEDGQELVQFLGERKKPRLDGGAFCLRSVGVPPVVRGIVERVGSQFGIIAPHPEAPAQRWRRNTEPVRRQEDRQRLQ